MFSVKWPGRNFNNLLSQKYLRMENEVSEQIRKLRENLLCMRSGFGQVGFSSKLDEDINQKPKNNNNK